MATKFAPKCVHNDGVDCVAPTAAKCAVCGWNPKVITKRRKHLNTRGLVRNERTGMSFLPLKKGV